MAKIVYICKDCNSENEIEIFALSSEGFNLSCPSCNRERWYSQTKRDPDDCPVCFGDKYLLWSDGLMHPCPSCKGAGKRAVSL